MTFAKGNRLPQLHPHVFQVSLGLHHLPKRVAVEMAASSWTYRSRLVGEDLFDTCCYWVEPLAEGSHYLFRVADAGVIAATLMHTFPPQE